MTSSKAWIAGCSGHVVTDSERAFFADERPWGFILFKRNVDSPSQVRDLVASLRDSVGRPNAPVLIDQEGGRVQRLGPPHWRSYPPARAFGHAAETGMLHRRALAWLGARLIAHDLHALGITVDCLPVLDVPVAGAHDVIGNRAYSERPDDVAIFGRAA
jgi:beta-N-acetylhexosaminidase